MARCLCAAAILGLLFCATSCREEPTSSVCEYPHEAILSAGQSFAPAPAVGDYPTLTADAERQDVVQAYLDAWRRRSDDPQAFDLPRDRLFALYADVYASAVPLAEHPRLDEGLRLLWDLTGLAHNTALSPAVIKEAVGWHDLPLYAATDEAALSLSATHRYPLLTVPHALPSRVRDLLQSVLMEADGSETFLDWICAEVRGIYLTQELVNWSPNCPFDVCGSSEPLTRTVILQPVGYVDLAPKEDWSLAAVTAHECAHIAWFHRPEVSEDPRLLLPVPNERWAWIITARFLRGLLRAGPNSQRGYLVGQADDIRTMLTQARQEIRKTNRALGLAEDDESLHLSLAADITMASLRGSTVCEARPRTGKHVPDLWKQLSGQMAQPEPPSSVAASGAASE